MKIGIISSLELPTPPVKYGGTERIVSELTETLVGRGHDITLFATGNSNTKAHLISETPRGLMEDNYPINPNAAYLVMLDKIASMSSQFDLIHNHLGWRFLPFNKHCKCTVINTYHAPYNHPRVKFIFEQYKDLFFTSISNNQQHGLDINFIATVYNGIPVSSFPFSDSPETENIIHISRIDESKGIDTALHIAINLGKHITVIGKVETENREQVNYYNQEVEPLLTHPHVTAVEEAEFDKKVSYLKNSKVFLFPLRWEEPFGLVVVEALACGTPVVAYARGAVPEIMQDGITGFIVNASDKDRRGDWIVKKTGIEGIREAVERIYSMSPEEYKQMRHTCRKHVEEKFTVERMVDGYEKVYQEILEDKR